MSRKDIKRRLMGHMEAAAEEAAAARAAHEDGTLDFQALDGYLRRYVLFKFNLTPDEATDSEGVEIRSIGVLAQLSLDKALADSASEALNETRSATCDGADSVTVKQALLLAALQRDFDARVDGFKLALAEGIDDISRLIWKAWS